MRKILLLLLISNWAQAQIVNIPDTNFKNKLLAANSANSIAGNLATYPTTGNYCVIDTNGDGQIQLTEAQAITMLNVSYSNISSLQGIESFTNLKWLFCNSNNITSINVLPLTQLVTLMVSSNQLTAIDVSTLGQLSSLSASINSIGAIDLSGCPNLISLSIDQNNLSTINLSQNPGIKFLFLGQNNLTVLNVSMLPELQNLMIDGNSISTLDLANNNAITSLSTGNNPVYLDIAHLNLTSLYCYGATNSTIDVSHCHGLNNLGVGGPSLQSILMKNGRNESLNLYNCPNLQFVCADDTQLLTVQTTVDSYAPDAVVGSYCSFVPGGNYNTITGTVNFDLDNDGCDDTDVKADYLRVNINGPGSGATYINGAGNYTFYTGIGNHTVTPQLEQPGYFNVSPVSATANFPLLDNSTIVRDFCLTANGYNPDVEIVLLPLGNARAGFDAHYQIVYKNKGNQIMSGQITLDFEGDILDFVSASTAPTIQTGNLLTWIYSNLLPFEARTIDLYFAVNAPTDVPAVNAGDVLHFTAGTNFVADDATPDDNYFAFNQTVANALDPNDKTCLEGEIVTPQKIGQYLHYNINFENIGTAEAQNVVIKDMIDTAQFNLATLQVMYASHPVRVLVTGNKVEFIFQDINLPSALSNPIGGHGNVLFKIKTLPTLQAGDIVTNTANIYFDYNHPIETNEARTTFAILKTQEFTTDNSVVVYPNPAKDKIAIQAASAIMNIVLFDVQGRVLQVTPASKMFETFDLSSQAIGLYFLKIKTAGGVKVVQIIKE